MAILLVVLTLEARAGGELIAGLINGKTTDDQTGTHREIQGNYDADRLLDDATPLRQGDKNSVKVMFPRMPKVVRFSDEIQKFEMRRISLDHDLHFMVGAGRFFNVERWIEMARGGHFAAMEVPELLAADIRTWFRTFRDERGTEEHVSMPVASFLRPSPPDKRTQVAGTKENTLLRQLSPETTIELSIGHVLGRQMLPLLRSAIPLLSPIAGEHLL